MILSGTIFITSDLDVVRDLSINHKIVVFGETAPTCIPTEYIIPASILLPPYEALEAEIDGNLEKYGYIYSAHLQTKEASEFIAVLILAVLRGANILLYITLDELELSYCNFFLAYMYNKYGIAIGTHKSPFSYEGQVNEMFDWILCNELYRFDLIKTDEYFTLFPACATIIPEYNVIKLANEINPYTNIPINHELYHQYFIDYINRVKQAGVVLINPISNSGG
jgi:hypothetical protein